MKKKQRISAKKENGLKVPCVYKIKGPYHMVTKVKKLVKDYLKRTK